MSAERVAMVIDDGWSDLLVRSPFDTKDAVKALAKRWNPDKKAWLVSRYLRAELVAVLRQLGCRVIEVDAAPRRTTPPRARPVPGRPWPEVMFAGIPAGLRHKAYRALAAVLHPDAGGNTEAMQVLNTCWDSWRRAEKRAS